MAGRENILKNASWLLVVIGVTVVLPFVLVDGGGAPGLARAEAADDAVLTLRVIDGEGAPAANARVQVIPEGADAGRFVVTDAEGRWRGSLSRGNYELCLGSAGALGVRSLVRLENDLLVELPLRPH